MRDLHTVFSMEIAFLSSLTTFSTDRISCGIYTRGTSLMLTYPFLLYLKYIICSKITSDYFFGKTRLLRELLFLFYFVFLLCIIALTKRAEILCNFRILLQCCTGETFLHMAVVINKLVFILVSVCNRFYLFFLLKMFL